MSAAAKYFHNKAEELRSLAAEMDRRADVLEHEETLRSRQYERSLARKYWLSLSPAERYHEACESSRHNQIVQAVLRNSSVTVEELCSLRRTAHVAHVRQISMYLLYKSGLSSNEVGEILNRHHTTVLVGHNAIARRMESSAFRQQIAKIQQPASETAECITPLN